MDPTVRNELDVAGEKLLMEEELQSARGHGLFVAGRARQEWSC